MKKYILLATLGGSMLLLSDAVHAAEGKKTEYQKMYSKTQKPELYGTKKAILHEGDKVSIIDPRY